MFKKMLIGIILMAMVIAIIPNSEATTKYDIEFIPINGMNYDNLTSETNISFYKNNILIDYVEFIGTEGNFTLSLSNGSYYVEAFTIYNETELYLKMNFTIIGNTSTSFILMFNEKSEVIPSENKTIWEKFTTDFDELYTAHPIYTIIGLGIASFIGIFIIYRILKYIGYIVG